MAYVITQNCCNDASCVEVCPVDCIHPAPEDPGFATAEMLYIDPGECIDCGACQDACPVSAVYPDFELPGGLAEYAALNAEFFDWAGEAPTPAAEPPPAAAAAGQSGPLRVAVVGAGPSGWYVANELAATRRADVEVTVLDRLATPHGLVRYGVAPDHLETKSVTAMFEATARHRRVAMRLNVEVGRDLSHTELLAYHHAVVYATGAPAGRSLGVAGENLPGSVSASEFVGWYNGHPDHAECRVDIGHSRAVVIGTGNVALDVSRLLLSGPEELRRSDIAPEALEALSAGRVEEVVVTGRRAARFAAFTSPELRALVRRPDIDVVVDPADAADIASAAEAATERTEAAFALRQKAALLTEAAAKAGASSDSPAPGAGRKRLVLRFGLTPDRILGDGTVTGIGFRTADGTEEVIEAGLVVRANGFRSLGVEGVPLDEPAGRFAHREGRVLDPDSGKVHAGTYATGWAKRGPSGAIGTNRACAAETVSALLDDYCSGLLPEPSAVPGELDTLLASRGVRVLDHSAWRALDQHELDTGKRSGRPRVKVTDRAEQVRVAAAATPHP